MTKKSSSSSIQALYDLCKKCFSPSRSAPPSSQVIQKLCSLLGTSLLVPFDLCSLIPFSASLILKLGSVVGILRKCEISNMGLWLFDVIWYGSVINW